MTYLAARPTVYSGIQMRSRLEATFAEALDRVGFSWQYEPRAYGAKGRRQYLPDFELTLPSGHHVFIEVKPTIEKAYLAMERMAVIWDSDPDADLIVTTPDGPSWTADRDRLWMCLRFPWGYRP